MVLLWKRLCLATLGTTHCANKIGSSEGPCHAIPWCHTYPRFAILEAFFVQSKKPTIINQHTGVQRTLKFHSFHNPNGINVLLYVDICKKFSLLVHCFAYVRLLQFLDYPTFVPGSTSAQQHLSMTSIYMYPFHFRLPSISNFLCFVSSVANKGLIIIISLGTYVESLLSISKCYFIVSLTSCVN